MRVLLVNHTAGVSGAEIALLQLICGLRERHELAVASPPGGRFQAAVTDAGLPWLPVRASSASMAVSPRRTTFEVLDMARASTDLVRAQRRFRPDVIHANSVRAGLLAAPVAHWLAPVVVQCHDHLPANRLGLAVRRTIAATASAVTGVTDATVQSFDTGLRRAVATRCHIAIDHDRFDPARIERPRLRDELGIGDAPLLAEVAQITPWKGQDTAIRVLAGLLDRVPDTHLALAGTTAFDSVRYDNQSYAESLHDLVERLDVADRVHFLGFRDDVPAIMATADLTLLPSWDEPFGSVVAESMAMGTPVLATAIGGVHDYLEDGVGGRVLDPFDPPAWSAAAADLLEDRQELAAMGSRAKAVAARFTVGAFADCIETIYEGVLTARS